MDLNVNVTANGHTVEILQGQALSPKAPVQINILGCIDSPRKFLEKRSEKLYLFESHVLVNRQNNSIKLVINETNGFTNDSVTGKFQLHADFTKFKINTGENWTTFDLSDFIKMNRYCFESKEIAIKLVKDLREFKAKVERNIEMSKDDRAQYSQKKQQAVESNLPTSFNIKVPVFKGQKPIVFEIEIYIHPETLQCSLNSPMVNDIVNNTVDAIINDEIAAINAICPELVIIEQ